MLPSLLGLLYTACVADERRVEWWKEEESGYENII